MAPVLDLLDREFLKTLRVLDLMARKYFSGEQIGARRTRHKGASQEFSDYREYNPGDDLRFLDWNIYGRLDRLFVKLFHSEESLEVYILVDSSRSMEFGSPSKFDHARKIAAAVAYLALSKNDGVRIFPLGEPPFDSSRRGHRLSDTSNLFRYLENLSTGGRAHLARSVQELVSRHPRRGLVFVISDYLGLRGIRKGLGLLNHSGYEANSIHVLDPRELSPPWEGPHQLKDAETGSTVCVDLDEVVRQAYRETAEEYLQETERTCIRAGASYIRSLTDVPFQSTVLSMFGKRR